MNVEELEAFPGVPSKEKTKNLVPLMEDRRIDPVLLPGSAAEIKGRLGRNIRALGRGFEWLNSPMYTEEQLREIRERAKYLPKRQQRNLKKELKEKPGKILRWLQTGEYR
jgi:hypothetical protein